MRCLLVSHFHWDREWYRTFQASRARLLDAVDAVLDALETDPMLHFVLDGQVVLLEDYLALRPQRRDALVRGVRSGRLAIGPWYVQPDSLLPSGESHVRNLLLGRAVGEAFGPVSRVAYLPDSFGHPAQLPQLFAGFDLAPFVYWRGDGDALARHGGRYRWVAPDGSEVPARLLHEGYFNAAFLPDDAGEAAAALATVAERLDAAGEDPVLLMNGFDHMFPDLHAGEVAAALQAARGWEVRRGVLDALRDEPRPAAEFRGALDGASIANLLPGVWSARMPIKLAARRCETLLTGWLEPWIVAALAEGVPDERPALDAAWRLLLQCQAHDSIGGCATDAVAAQVEARLAEAVDLAAQTVDRVLAGLAGLGRARSVPLSVEQTIAVFNPSPHARTDVVRIALEDYPALRLPLGAPALGPLSHAVLRGSGFTVDGRPARLVPSDDPSRARWVPGVVPLDLEFVAADVPPLGARRFRLAPAAASSDVVDDGREIGCDAAWVVADEAGTLSVRLGGQSWTGLCDVEDRGDRGDTYDFDAVAGDAGATLRSVVVERRRHPSGVQTLLVRRTFDVPAALAADRRARLPERVPLVVETVARVAPGVRRVDLTVRVDNRASDHRLRLRFPTGRPSDVFETATTFDVARRPAALAPHPDWVHPAPATFCHQGWVAAGGLMVVAPGLPEAEVTPDGTIAVTLLRAVGTLARFDLASRPLPAGPEMPAPAAQLHGTLVAHLALVAGSDPTAARDAELGLRATFAAAADPAVGAPLLELGGDGVVLSALKPAARTGGFVVRLLNPTDVVRAAELRLGVPFASIEAVRLDEEPADFPVERTGGTIRLTLPPHALRSVLVRG